MSDNGKASGTSESMDKASQMMKQLQEEAEAIKAGTITTDVALALSRHRGLQLRLVEAGIKYARMHRGLRPVGEMPLIAGAVEAETIPEKKKEEPGSGV